MTHLDVDRADVAHAAEMLAEVLAGKPARSTAPTGSPS